MAYYVFFLFSGALSRSPPRSCTQSALTELDRAERLAAKVFLAAVDDAVKVNEPLELDTLPSLSVAVIV